MKQEMKFRVKSPEHSAEIQKSLFTDGYGWACGRYKHVDETDKEFLYTDDDGSLLYGNEKEYFEDNKRPEYELYCGIIQPVCKLPQPTRCPPMHTVKPPLGLRPRHIAEQQRTQEIISAMARYAVDGVSIPVEWITELADLNMEKM